MGERELLRAGAGLSFFAGAAHAAAAPEHLAEWWGYGLFFLLASMAQFYLALALAVAARAAGEAEPARCAELDGTRDFVMLGLPARAFYLLGVLGNAAVIALYTVTRTVGVPLIGPDAGEVEPVTALGVASKLVEGALIAALLGLLRGGAAARPAAERHA
jgi:hypothetical protein